MDDIKMQRKILRTAFTNALKAFEKKMDSDCSREEKLREFQILETKMTDLDTVHSAYKQLLYQSGMEDADTAKDDAYKTHYLRAKMRVEVPEFSGNVEDWEPFWKQFKKINDDPSITNEDKFKYLQQTTVPNSRADKLVKTEDNYEKAITSLKNIIVEFYVRELLSLVLQKGNSNLSLEDIYNKIKCYIQALESLGVTTDKYAAILYPLVESSLPEEVLGAWSILQNIEEQPKSSDRLEKLLTFLQAEVEKERIKEALTRLSV